MSKQSENALMRAVFKALEHDDVRYLMSALSEEYFQRRLIEFTDILAEDYGMTCMESVQHTHRVVVAFNHNTTLAKPAMILFSSQHMEVIGGALAICALGNAQVYLIEAGHYGLEDFSEGPQVRGAAQDTALHA